MDEGVIYTYHLRSAPQRDYKMRNILTLEDRVEVIRDYDRRPVYQRLAEKYNCSTKQIKNIIANRKSVLREHESYLQDGTASAEGRRQREQKIVFLGKVIYEYIQRAVYYRRPVSAERVQRKARDVKESIAILNFSPNNAWLQNFKAQYQLHDIDSATLRRQSSFLCEPEEDSFNTVDIIDYVREREKQESLTRRKSPLTPCVTEDSELRSYSPVDTKNRNEHQSNTNHHYSDSLHQRKRQSDRTPLTIALSSQQENKKNNNATAARQCAGAPSKPLPDIDSYREALRHLQVLEDYALLNENFRAIGLITQLQQAFKDPPKGVDFIA